MFDKAFPVFHVWPDGLRHHRPSVILSFWPSGCVNAWMWISLHSGYEVSQLNGIDNWMKVCCPLGIAVVKSDLNLWCWTSCLMECHLLLLCPNTLHSSNPTHQSGVLTYCISPTKSEVFVWRSANDPGRRQYHSFDSQTRIGNHREIGGGQFPFSARIDSSCLCIEHSLQRDIIRWHTLSISLSKHTNKHTHLRIRTQLPHPRNTNKSSAFCRRTNHWKEKVQLRTRSSSPVQEKHLVDIQGLPEWWLFPSSYAHQMQILRWRQQSQE